MTIAVCCTLADGVVVGTDSAITVTGAINTPQGVQQGVLKVYNDAEKVFGFHVDVQKDLRLPVGLVTYGLATLGNRTIESFVREFEIKNPAAELKKLTMEKLCRKLHEFFRERYVTLLSEALRAQGKKLEEIPLQQRPVLGMFVGGFSPEAPLPEAWEVNIHLDEKPDGVKRIRAPGDFGSNWGGQFTGVQRFHKGFDVLGIDALVNALVEEYKMVDPANPKQVQRISEIVQGALAPFEYQVPFAAMPLQEGIDYTAFLLDMMILQHRFVIGAPTCGGKVRIAVIRKLEGFEWVAGQHFEVRGSRYA